MGTLRNFLICFRFKKQRKEIAQIMRRLYQQRLTTTSGGNISLRLGNIVIITASQTDKGNMTFKDVGVILITGKNLTPKLKPTIESEMHLSIYNARPDISAIVHAHPVYATALTASQGLIETDISCEAYATIGVAAFAEYRAMGTSKLAHLVAEKSKNSNIVIMQHHGIVAMGKTLLQSFDRLEAIETTAQATVIRKICNIVNKPDNEQLTSGNS